MNRKYWIVAAVFLAVALLGPLLISIREKPEPELPAPPLDAASAASKSFLERYVEPDGRVVRRDQNGDTVSEGQAYAMLVAAATGDRGRFESVWNWAKVNLLQPNGMLAWKWEGGKVVDSSPATDADLDAARALIAASKRFNNPGYAEEARLLARSIADNSIAYSSKGDPVLLAGPWAKTAPFYTNPSYHSPRSESDLYALTEDNRWRDLMQSERERVNELIGTSRSDVKLPPDWARVSANNSVEAVGPPSNPGDTPKYSFDAVRLPVRLAESCDKADRDQAARLWTILSRSPTTRTSAEMTLEGQPAKQNSSTVVGAVAAAAGAQASGDVNEALRMLELADRIDASEHTYYGSAWAALGRIMLTTTWLGNC